MNMRTLLGALALTFGLGAVGATPDLEAATNAALAAERASTPPVVVAGPTRDQVDAEINTSKAAIATALDDIANELAALEARIAALFAGAPPDPDPIPDPDPVPVPDPPPVTGAIETGNSGMPLRITPDFHGHGFTTDSMFWNEVNRSVLGDAVDPRSAHLIGMLAGNTVHMDFFGGTVGKGPDSDHIWGIPINVVSGTQPRVPVDVGAYASESEHIDVPIPANVAIEGWNQSTMGLPTKADLSNDRHMLIVVRDEATGGISELIELYQVYHDVAGWHTNSLSQWVMANGLPRREGWTSGDAAGFPIVPFMATYSEVASGVISHPIRMTFAAGYTRNRYIFPARHTALNGQVADGIPFGARLRLSAAWYSAHKAEFTGAARVFIEAFRNYGVVNADIGGTGFLCGISDDRFDNTNLMTLQNVPLSAFEVLTMAPQFEPIGPTSVAVNTPTTYTFKFNPLHEPNGAHGYYLHAFEQGPNGTWVQLPDDSTAGIQPHQVGYNDANPSFVFKARKTGPHLIEVDQAGESKLEWTPPTQPIPGRGPYPYLNVDVH